MLGSSGDRLEPGCSAWGGWSGWACTSGGCTVAAASHACSGLLVSVAERVTTFRRPRLSLPTSPDPR